MRRVELESSVAARHASLVDLAMMTQRKDDVPRSLHRRSQNPTLHLVLKITLSAKCLKLFAKGFLTVRFALSRCSRCLRDADVW